MDDEAEMATSSEDEEVVMEEEDDEADEEGEPQTLASHQQPDIPPAAEAKYQGRDSTGAPLASDPAAGDAIDVAAQSVADARAPGCHQGAGPSPPRKNI